MGRVEILKWFEDTENSWATYKVIAVGIGVSETAVCRVLINLYNEGFLERKEEIVIGERVWFKESNLGVKKKYISKYSAKIHLYRVKNNV